MERDSFNSDTSPTESDEALMGIPGLEYDQLLEQAVEEERQKGSLIITPGQLSFLRRVGRE